MNDKPDDIAIYICQNGFIIQPRVTVHIPPKELTHVFETPEKLAAWIKDWAERAQKGVSNE